MKKNISIVFAIILLLMLNNRVSAHPGRLAANNMHYCWTNCEQWGLQEGEQHLHVGGTYINSKNEIFSSDGTFLSDALTFTDVPYGSTYYNTIEDIVKRGIANGIGNNLFGVNDSISRAQAAVMLVNALGIDRTGKKIVMADVPLNHWANSHIAAAIQSGIMNGYASGKFGPEDDVTRAQLAVMVTNAFKIQSNPDRIKEFPDVPLNHWAYKQIQALVSNGVINGYSTGYFGDEDPATRGQFTVFISKALKLTKR